VKSFLALLAFLTQAGVHVERVSIPTPDGVTLDAALVLPDGPPHGPAVVALHGCGGPFPSRDGSWAVELAHAGHIVLLPDSFGSRRLGSQCSERRPASRQPGPAGMMRSPPPPG
jgi:dienelactone hydrolase